MRRLSGDTEASLNGDLHVVFGVVWALVLEHWFSFEPAMVVATFLVFLFLSAFVRIWRD